MDDPPAHAGGTDFINDKGSEPESAAFELLNFSLCNYTS